MGVVHVDNMLMILSACRNMDPLAREIVAKEFVKGFYGSPFSNPNPHMTVIAHVSAL